MDEILRYFSQNTGFTRLMNGMWDLYARYMRCYGAVRLHKPSPEEEKALSDFFKRDYYDQALIRISLADFERQMQKTFVVTLGLNTLLEGYFSRSLVENVDKGTERQRVRDSFSTYIKTMILPKYEKTGAEEWLREMLAHMRRTYKHWAELFIEEPETVTEQVTAVCNALNALSQDEYVRLADFSTQICGHPRALDFGGSHGALFLRALARRFDVPVPSSLEESITLYWQAGLLSNGVLNQVIVSGLPAYCGDEADTACSYYDDLGEAHVLTLENISRFTHVEAYKGRVYVVESAEVFTLLCERLRGIRYTLICASSGMNAALDRLLTLCYENETEIYYSGNMDYKGLLLGDSMHLRYEKHFVPWRYDKSDYERALKESDALLPDEKKDLAMHSDKFASLLSLIRKKGKIASHIALVSLLAGDIKTYMGG